MCSASSPAPPRPPTSSLAGAAERAGASNGPRDAIFKTVFSDLACLTGLLRAVLPSSVVEVGSSPALGSLGSSPTWGSSPAPDRGMGTVRNHR